MRSLAVLFIAALAIAGIASKLAPETHEQRTVAALLTERDPPAGFQTATRARTFDFPADHASHPRFRSEWWYFTGNTDTDGGKALGFQVTIFRFALRPPAPASRSPWRRPDVYLGHFAVTDIGEGTFHHFERRSRGVMDLAGARDAPVKIWIRDWSIELVDPQNETWRISARASGVGLNLVLRSKRPVTPQGNNGLSSKSAEPGNASYYYSIPRLAAAGTIETPEGVHRVRGNAWYDHEWSTSALAEDQVGWDWFSLQLDDGSDLMFYQIRDVRGHADPVSHGIILSPDGARTELEPEGIDLTVRGHWRSRTSGTRYPAAWSLHVPGRDLTLTVTPRLANQEWRGIFTYWEGAVQVSGVSAGRRVKGTGYVELVGYD
ncbi:MAG TPA: lipocalin-like domain-containing protein [Gammaproteobacteria bacterium]|jgi:predicted secreted hydrolase|nr:lipocalin-like domain-containing protein [Gammaproteobacteria bacterium]